MLGVGFLVVVLFIQYLKNIFAFCLMFMVSDKKSIVILIVHHPSLLPSKFVVFNFQKFIRIYFRVDWFGVILFRICSASWIWLCICLLPNLGCFQPLMLFFWDFFPLHPLSLLLLGLRWHKYLTFFFCYSFTGRWVFFFPFIFPV